MKIVDLSRELYHRTPSYPGHPPVMHGVWKTHEESFAESGNVHGLASMFISMVDHAGTHIDAPRHFGKSGISIDEYPLEKCIVPGICIDLRHIAPRAEITAAELEAAVKTAGVPVPTGGTVLLCTGHHARTFPRKEYATDNCGVNVAATEWLARQGVVHFGIVMLLNLGIGLLTPPVGTTLFVGCAIGKVSVDEVMRGIWPFYYVMFTVLMIVTYVPWLSLALPRAFGF